MTILGKWKKIYLNRGIEKKGGGWPQIGRLGVYDYVTKQLIMWLYVIIMSHTSFRVNLHYSLPECHITSCLKQVTYLKFKWWYLHAIICLNVTELLTWSRCHIWSLSVSNRIQTHNHLVHKRNGLVLVYELSGSGFEFCYCHLHLIISYATVFHTTSVSMFNCFLCFWAFWSNLGINLVQKIYEHVFGSSSWSVMFCLG